MGILTIVVAVLAIIPSPSRKMDDQTGSTDVSSTPTVATHAETSPTDQHAAPMQTRPIQRLPQVIIEALRPSQAPSSPSKPNIAEEKKPEPELDIGRPVQRLVPSGDYESFEYGLQEGEELTVEVNGDGPLNVYLLTEENLSSLDSDQEFWYETGNEFARSTKLEFAPEESGTWFLVIENCENRDVTATIKVTVDKPSHPVPFLKSEKIEMPGQKLEGKLGT